MRQVIEISRKKGGSSNAKLKILARFKACYNKCILAVIIGSGLIVFNTTFDLSDIFESNILMIIAQKRRSWLEKKEYTSGSS